MASGSKKAILAALFANLSIAIAKFIGYVFTSSSSMLAEAIHSVADTSNQALLLLGNKRATKDATAQHSFGYGRERYFWSFIVALVLFSLGGLFAIYEGWHKLGEEGHEVSNVQWAVGISGSGYLARRLFVPNGGEGIAATKGVGRLGGSSFVTPARPSSPSCFSRTSAPSWVWFSR